MKRGRTCGFEQREQVAKFGYWEDSRWVVVRRLRKEGKQTEANGLVEQIRSDWGVE